MSLILYNDEPYQNESFSGRMQTMRAMLIHVDSLFYLKTTRAKMRKYYFQYLETLRKLVRIGNLLDEMD